MNRRVPSLTIAIAIGVVVSIMRFTGCGYLHLLDQRTIDYRLLQRGPQPHSGEVVIVAVDDESVEQLGRWPWSRHKLAELVDRIALAEPSVVGFDIVQSESEASVDVVRLKKLMPGLPEMCWAPLTEAIGAVADPDEDLARAIASLDAAVLGYFFDIRGPHSPAGGEQSDGAGVEPDDEDSEFLHYDKIEELRGSSLEAGLGRLPSAVRRIPNVTVIRDAAYGEAFFNVFPDTGDGAVRRIPLAIRYKDKLAVPLAVGMVRAYRPNDTFYARLADFGVEKVMMGLQTIPTAENGQLLVNYRGPSRTFEHVSAVELLRDDAMIERLRGKVVLIGVTATAVADTRVTPLDAAMPGVEVQATVVDNILTNDFITQPKWIVLVEIGAILLCMAVLGWLLRAPQGLRNVAVTVSIGAAYFFGSQLVFRMGGASLGFVYPGVAIATAAFVITTAKYVVEEREKREIRQAFGQYLSPQIVEILAKDPSALELGGEEKELTVLFTDIRSFTVRAEQLEPNELTSMLQEFFTPMSHEILDHKGTIDKYMGDAIMAFWNAPLDDPEHARNACRTALRFFKVLPEINAKFAKVTEGAEVPFNPIKIGVGIAAGLNTVGNMGSDVRFNYTVMGDTTNLAARLQDLTKDFNVPIVVGEKAQAAAPDMAYLEIGQVRVRGKLRPSRAFALLGDEEMARSDAFLELAAAHRRFLTAYIDGHFDDAERLLELCVERGFPELTADPDFGIDAMYRYFYAGQIDAARIGGAEREWDGIYEG